MKKIVLVIGIIVAALAMATVRAEKVNKEHTITISGYMGV